jgi:E3 ubiquitin-protein ligase TRIP12
MVKSVNPNLYSSLKQLLEISNTVDMDELMLDFTLPGYPEFELMANGSNVSVTKDNIQSYVDLVIEATVGSGVHSQIQSFKSGFETFIPTHFFDCFSVDDIGMIIGGEENQNWNSQGTFQ